MPIIRVELLEGRTVDEKAKLAAVLTDAYVDLFKIDPEGIHVIIDEKPLTNWALGGKPFAERWKNR